MFSLNDSIQISSFNTPLDARTKVNTLSNLTDGSIQMPYVGLIVWITSEEKAYVVTGVTGTLVTSYKPIGDDTAITFAYTVGTTKSSELSEAISANKIITIGNYVASVEMVGTGSSAYYVVSYTDKDGVFHQITHTSQANSTGTETTKEFAEVETVNSISELGLSGVIGGIKKYQGNTMLDLGGVSGSGTLGNAIKRLISLGVHVDADDTNNVFAIKNINNETIGSITLGTNATNGAAELTFVAGSNQFTASLPNLTYDSTNQMLKYIDAGGDDHDLIRLSNLQIKTVFDYSTYGGTAPTSPSTGTYAIGDLALVEKQDISTTPATVSYELAVVQSVTAGTPNTVQWQEIGSINNVSLQADQVGFDKSTNGFSATNVQGAIEEVNEKFNSTTELDLSKLSVSKCRLAGNATWVNAGDESHYWIPCNPNDTFRITAGDYNFSYGFLTQHSPTINSSASPCSVYQGTLPAGNAESTFTVVAPSDAIGLAINKMVRTQQESESSDKGPDKIEKLSSIRDDIQSLGEDIEAIRSELAGEEIEVEPYSTKTYAKTAAGVIYENSGQYYHPTYTLKWYPIRRGQTFHFTLQVNKSKNLSVSFYNASEPNTTINNKLVWNHIEEDSSAMDVTYTAGEDGIVCFVDVEDDEPVYTLTVQSKNYDDVINSGYNFTSIPRIGCGTEIVSRPTDTYCHAPMICESTNYRFICYHAGDTITAENTSGVTYVVLLVVNKKTGASKYINVFDYKKPDTIDGNECSVYYNQSIIVLGDTDTLMIRCGCQCNNKWMLIYKTYNATTDTLSAASKQQISYNGNTYDLNLANYITMVNNLYSKSFTVVDLRITNEITSMCYYNNKYYCVMAYICNNITTYPTRDVPTPHVFAVSDDAITWQPIANITDVYYNAETLLTIVNGIVYHVFRSDRLGTFYMVFDLQGNILKAPEPTSAPLSKVWSKPAIAYSGGRVLIGFNKPENSETGNNIGGRRSKMCLAEIAQSSPYGLTEYKTYISANGWNYYYFSPKKNGNLLVVNAEDSRCFNYESDGTHGAVTDVNICEIDMLEIIENIDNS